MSQRYEYGKGTLEADDLNPSPTLQLRSWLDEAAARGVTEPGAMCLSTVSPEGRPSSRFVLLRGLDERGLCFYSNYRSRKGRDLEANPFSCVAIWWRSLERQVRVEGRVERLSPEESDAYFHSRPRDSQIASASSPQSQVIADRQVLEAQMEALVREHSEGEIPRPEHWGGYRLVPDYFEFWQGRAARLHDRICYRRQEAAWEIVRLAP